VKALYHHTEKYHNYNAPREVVPLIIEAVNPKSVLDVGCGIGTWLKIFQENGIDDYVGIDGNYVDKSLLKIPAEKFVAEDLRRPWSLNRKFDLAISLEVAEHLPESSADTFVKMLVDHADTILFSAAIPHQGGQNHLNEQWPSYWEKKFNAYNFYFHDPIRPKIWDNKNVDWWYRQNIFLIRKNIRPTVPYMTTIHPELFELNHQYETNLHEGRYGVTQALSILWRAIRRKF
jgi:SAM-dependent methyltransferase